MSAFSFQPPRTQVGDEPRIKAFVVLKDQHRGQIDANEIINFCKQKLSPYAAPTWIEFRDSLPMTSTEKLFKKQLRDEEIKKMK